VIFNYNKRSSNIVVLTMDMKEKSVNLMNEIFFDSLNKNIIKLEKESNLAGIIITSAKKTFLAGADLDIFYKQNDPNDCLEFIENGKKIMRRLELIGKPTVAAVNGTALGGGMELALCCHRRIVIDSPNSKFGFPEVNFGLLPGGGGITRLSRLIGIEKALPFLMEGKQVSAKDAVDAGLMDELAISFEEMIDIAEKWILNNQGFQQPWDRKNFTIPGGDAYNSKNAGLLAISPAILVKKTKGNFPAPEAILSTIAEGSLVDFDTASKIESRFFVQLATGKISKNMINAFWFQLNKINSGVSRPNNIPKIDTQKVGILGSGLMGHGIAYVSAMSGMDVVMTDVSQENADKGMSKIKEILFLALKKGLIEEDKMEEVLARIQPTSNYSDLKDCDLIIEAVFEDRDLKSKVTSLAEKELSENGIFASNTSTIPITELSRKSSFPERFIGIHFFSPVQKMRLVEIIKGEKTNSETLAKAFDYVLKIKKIPIVVNDGVGFYTTRVFERYTCEGMALLAEGNLASTIESAGQKAGFPVGPLAVIDEISIDLAAHIRDELRKSLDNEKQELANGPWDSVIDFMTQEANRKGRADGKGFYNYPSDGRKYLWPELEQYYPPSVNQLDQAEMIDRFLFLQAIEAVKCLEEGVLTSVPDANIGSIFGWGFPAFKGGVLQFINDYGLKSFKRRANELEKKYGHRFACPQTIDRMIINHKVFIS